MGLRAMRPSFRLLSIDDTILLSRGKAFSVAQNHQGIAIAGLLEIRLTVQGRAFLVKGRAGCF
jgi:hypothetical protein